MSKATPQADQIICGIKMSESQLLAVIHRVLTTVWPTIDAAINKSFQNLLESRRTDHPNVINTTNPALEVAKAVNAFLGRNYIDTAANARNATTANFCDTGSDAATYADIGATYRRLNHKKV